MALGLLTACKPPAADDYAGRDKVSDTRETPADPITSPDTSAALWAPVADGNRLLFGNPGERAFVALVCEQGQSGPRLRLVRNAPADPRASALFALIGNGHVERLPMEARLHGKEWRWEGEFDANDTRLDVFSGPRTVEATLPGAGSVIINPSKQPARFIDRCRSGSDPDQPAR